MRSFVSILICSFIVFVHSASAQNSAPSSHLVFGDRFDGDTIINRVRVPKQGEALYTYYEALGWRGKAAGYAGIQSHPRGRNFIFSIWDHKDHTAPIRAVYRGGGTETQKFGGEGTGLKSWNFKLGWKTDTWYTLVAKCWPENEHTFYGFWVHSDETAKWTHLVTMDVSANAAFIRGGTDAFIEDWLSTGKNPREVHYQKGWKRDLNQKWHPFQTARYSVNSWDLEKGKRSYNFRDNWDGGTVTTESENYFYMKSGGKDTKPTSKNPSKHLIKRSQKTPDFKKIELKKLEARRKKEGELLIRWEADPTCAPQFSYQIQLASSGKRTAAGAIKNISRIVPHIREHSIPLKDQKDFAGGTVSLICTDIFGRKSEPITVDLK